MLHSSIADIPEPDLVRDLMAEPHWQEVLLNIRGIPSKRVYRLTVPLVGASQHSSGDIDILLCPLDQPDQATAIEVKTVKIQASTFSGQKPNKLNKFGKGVQQANRLANRGFSQVYLFVLVAVDSREHNGGKISFAGPTMELTSLIERTIRPSKLLDRVGLAHYEFVQPMDHTPLTTGTSGCHLIRLAKQAVQPPELTEWVAQHMREAVGPSIYL